MKSTNPYKVYSHDAKSGFAIVELPENVLGGDDAMNFTNALQEVNDKDTKYVLADLSKVKVMNSSGLGMLVGSLRLLQKRNIALVLVGVSAKVDELLKMTHLFKVFKIFDNMDDAINNLE